MTSVTAKQLRENLSEIMDKVENGQEIVVIRHSRPAIHLVPAQLKTDSSKRVAEGIDRYLSYAKAAGIKSSLDPNKSFKQLYRESLANDPKYKPPYHR